MKTSNKILLGFFLALILSVTAVHLALYAKFTSGDFVEQQKAKELFTDHHALPSIRFVSITGLGNCSIIASGQPALEIKKSGNSPLVFSVIKDTLVINGAPQMATAILKNGHRNFQEVRLYLPGNTQINIQYSEVNLKGAADSLAAPSYVIHLLNDAALGMPERQVTGAGLYFNSLQVTASSSKLALDDHTFINDLYIRSVHSRINLEKALINHKQLNIDSSSSITVSGKNLKSLQISSEQ